MSSPSCLGPPFSSIPTIYTAEALAHAAVISPVDRLRTSIASYSFWIADNANFINLVAQTTRHSPLSRQVIPPTTAAMFCSAISGFFDRLDTYWTGKRTHKAASRQEAHDREAREQQWTEGHRQGPTSAVQHPGASKDYSDDMENQARPLRAEPQATRKKTVRRQILQPGQRSLETLEIGRIGTAEKFYRQ
ncbi:hypothetical protein DPSP01_011550 [Paraphaeosphaeria sporulosa]